jgi:redox-sensing transcriptional repressor
MKLPPPTVHRLCLLFRLLDQLSREVSEITSAQLGRFLGITADTIRKDISLLGEVKSGAAGYSLADLKRLIAEELGLGEKKRACIVGLSEIGTGLIASPESFLAGVDLVAGFDGDINRIERMKTSLPLYPAYEIPEVVRKEKIELAALTVGAERAQKMADRLVEGGIRGIVNFSPVVLQVPERVSVRNSYVVEEFRILSAYINLSKGA